MRSIAWLLILISIPVSAQIQLGTMAEQAEIPRVWKWSAASLGAGAVADIHSSWGKRELNPALASSDGRFGWRGTATKAAVTSGVLMLQYAIVRKHRSASKALAIANFAVGAFWTAVAFRNYSIQASASTRIRRQ
jgi:hypothetical protein